MKTHYTPQQVVHRDCMDIVSVCVCVCVCVCPCVLIACCTAMNHIISITVEIKHERIVKLSTE